VVQPRVALDVVGVLTQEAPRLRHLGHVDRGRAERVVRGVPHEPRRRAPGRRRGPDRRVRRDDRAARWSNGQVEGQVNRLKLLRRSMYGRAGFALLRRRVLAA
jgi:hypothetical protein